MISGVCFLAELPLAWLPASTGSAQEAARYLAVLAEFEQAAPERSREQEELHAKLDLALLWLARAQAGQLPPACPVQIGLEHLAWLADSPQPAASSGALALNLSDALPFLLQLPAQIESCQPEDGRWRITASLAFDDDTLRDWWERTVFRRHRRVIQQERGRQ